MLSRIIVRKMNKIEKLKELAKVSEFHIDFLKYVRIQEPGETALRYELWTHLIDFFDRLDRNRLNILLKSKQLGISWALASRVLRKLMTVPGSNILMLSSGQKESQKLLSKVRVIYENLPEWLIEEYNEPEPNSTEQFGFSGLRSLVTALPSTEKAGIGETSDWVIHDEADFHDFFEINLGHTLATVADSPTRELTIVSTVDKTRPDSYFKQLYKGARNSGFAEAGSNNFNAIFYPYYVRPNRDEGWYQQELLGHSDKIWEMEANYPKSAEEALSPQSAQSCFKKEVLDNLWYNVNRESEVRQGFIHILCPRRVGTQYVGGADIGEGIGRDYSCLVILGKAGLTYEVAAVIWTNTLATDLFAYECYQLCCEYFKGLLAVENNSIGVATLNKLQELGYTNLFSSEADGKRKKNVQIMGNEKAGWTTGEKNKDIALRELIIAVNDGSFITRFPPMIKEFMELQWINGKPVPTGKTHGDIVMASALAYQMAKQVKASFKPSLFVRGKQIF